MDSFDLMQFFYLSPVYSIVPLSALSYVLIQRKKKNEKIKNINEITSSRFQGRISIYHNDEITVRSAYDYVIPVLLATIVAAGGLYATFLVGRGEAGGSPFILGHYFGEIDGANDPLLISLVAIAWSFMGAFTFALQNIFLRYASFDLFPRVYYDFVIRVIYAVSLALLIRFIFEDFAATSVAPAVFFIVGAFPERGLVYIEHHVSRIPGFSEAQERVANNYPLSMIEGLSLMHRSRLKELGIDNVQNLASSDYVELLVRTPFNPETIASWVGEAKLIHIFGERAALLNNVGINDVFSFKLAYENKDIDLDTIAETTTIDKTSLEIAYQTIAADKFLELVEHFALANKPDDLGGGK